jgi:ribosomal protein S18 acetylase RimI-like enzyme
MVSLRAARPQDISAVLALWEQARSEQARTPDRRVNVERLIAECAGSLLLAEVDGEVVGALIAAWDGWRGNMYRLAVRSDHRRRGIALQLVRAGEAYLRGKGAHRITALVAYDDPVAAGFWEAAGYPPDRVMGRRVRNL